ncbi:MAG: hypothetical protein LBI89_03505 [Prevotellaceae bacterium]|nr:hypothetical protein [Prevotellaceae bacterium]
MESPLRCLVVSDLSQIASKVEWEGLKSLIKIESERSRRGMENSLHWVIDVGFNEDGSRKRNGFAA